MLDYKDEKTGKDHIEKNSKGEKEKAQEERAGTCRRRRQNPPGTYSLFWRTVGIKTKYRHKPRPYDQKH